MAILLFPELWSYAGRPASERRRLAQLASKDAARKIPGNTVIERNGLRTSEFIFGGRSFDSLIRENTKDTAGFAGKTGASIVNAGGEGLGALFKGAAGNLSLGGGALVLAALAVGGVALAVVLD